MTYDFHPEARDEYLEAVAFYERSRPGLGAAFTFEIEATIEHSRVAGSLAHHRARRAAMSKSHLSLRNLVYN